MRKVVVLVTIAALSICGIAAADTVLMRSGNVPVGQRDPLISVEGAPVIIGGISYPAAQVPLQQALVLTPYYKWAQLPGSAWVGVGDGTTTSPAGGYVYRTGFELPLAYTNPQITVTMSSDNHSLVALNGNSIGSLPQVPAEWSQLFVFNNAESTVFKPGWNELEFDLHNGASGSNPPDNPSGLLFRAEVAYTPVPEPTGLVVLGNGIVALTGLVRKRR